MKTFYSPEGEQLFSSNAKSEEDILLALQKHNVIKSVSGLVIEEDYAGRLFITDGIRDVASVE